MGIFWCILLYGGVRISYEEVGVNLISGIKNSVITRQSSTLSNYPSTNAIDGIDSQLIDSCGCCSATYGATPLQWWQINLGNKYLIDALEVFGRETNEPQQLQYAVIYAGNASLASNNTNGVVVYTIPKISNDNSHFIKYLQPAIIAQYFKISLNIVILTICEFKLYEKLCDVGIFGTGCSHQCHCLDEDTCNSVTGRCQTTGCLDGWQGLACDTRVNLISRLKDSVTTSQSSLFNNYDSSNAIDGTDNQLVYTCGCCSVTEGDIPSWWQINLGNKYLIDALEVFGRKTNQPQQLQDAVIYAGNVSLAGNNTNGVVVYTIPTSIAYNSHFIEYLQPAIIAQYFIITLQQKTLTICEFKLYEKFCDVGRFGAWCAHQCHCSDQQSCNSVTGICQTPGCLDGLQGLACDQKHIGIGNTEQKCTCDTGENETGSNINVTSVIIGASVGVVVSLACAISIGIIAWKYRTSKRTESKNEYTRPAHSSAPPEVPIYDTVDDRQDTSRPSSNVYINESVIGL